MRQDLTIGNTTFFIEKFPAMTQIKIFGDLQKTLLPSFGKLLAEFGKKNEENEENAERSDTAFIDGLRELSQQLDGTSLEKLVKELIKPDFVTFVRDDFNNGNDTKLTHDKLNAACEDMGEIIELLIFILKLNFGSFFTNYLTRLGVGIASKAA
ncbi:Uncharacterised protein [Actinobacillus pleuropneumoniae]|uniref:phage tail assembly chaperone n=1 Tax=Actinobacillus pleuropneumoniae TaxID=715 RepID=UPI0001E4A25D|nr:hypothetical protein [Actinobacillus pleuropneumoniae]EFM88748.1 hypothetical protein appser4_21230 [Actinobacillus pleuropneumoniae serovar 4 str. M62]UKH41038.1 hypothetical protein D1097_04295 [Actinobacillus pleuropneumoniae serovar 4 str. M62]SQF64571.1 Uncharacterised protein [Actinobacillus pleuropneumoniae]